MSDFRDDEFGKVEPIDDGFGKVEPIKTQNDGFGDVEPVEAEEHPPKSEKPFEEKKDEKPSIPDIPRGFSPTIDMANDVAEEARRRAAEEPKFKTRKERKSRMVSGTQVSTYGAVPTMEGYDADTVDEITDTKGNVAKRGDLFGVERKDGTSRLYEFTGDDENGHPTFRRLTEEEANGKTAKASMSGDVFRRMRGEGRIKMDSSAIEQVRQGVLSETGREDVYGEGALGQLAAVATRAIPYIGRGNADRYKWQLQKLDEMSRGDFGGKDYIWLYKSGIFDDDKVNVIRTKDESEEDWQKRMQAAASDELKKRVTAMQDAEEELGATDKGAWDKILGGFIDSSGYALEFAVPGGAVGKGVKGWNVIKGGGLLAKIGNAAIRQNVVSAPVTLAEASSRYTEMRTPGFAIDEDGNPYIRDMVDSPGAAALKSIGGALFDTNVEIGLEPVAMGMFRLGKRTAGMAFDKWTPQLMEGLAKNYGKFVHSSTGRLMHDFAKAYGEFADVTAINSPLGELAEEDVQALERVFNLDGKTSEYERGGGFAAEWSRFKNDQMSAKTQFDTFLGLVGQLLVGSAVSAYRTHGYRNSEEYQEGLKQERDLKGVLRLANVSEDTINSLSPEQMAVLGDMWKRYSANPDELKKNTRGLGLALRAAGVEMANRDGVRFRDSLEADGIEPEKFVFQGDESGRPVFKGITRIHGDNKTEQMDAMSDGKHGVTIVDNHDGTYSVMNDWRGSVPSIFNDFDRARAEADNQVMLNQRMDGDNERKAAYFEKYVAPNYEGRSIHVVQTVQQLREEVLQGVTQGGEEGYFGARDASSIFDENGELREKSAGGFHTPDGTTVLILDNIVSPADMERVTAHEAVGHEGVEGQVGRDEVVEFIGGVRAKDFSGFANGIWRKMTQDYIRKGYSTEEAQQIAADICDSDRYRKEIMAKYAEQRRHLPTDQELKQHDENEKRRAVGEDVPTDDADLEVMLWKAEQEARQLNPDKKHTKAGAVVQEVDAAETHENAPVSVPDEEGMTSRPEAEKPTEGEGSASGGAREEYVSGLNKYSTENDKRFVDVATEDEFAKANELRKKFTDDPSDEALKEFSDYVDGVIAKADEASAKANETAGVKPTPTVRSVEDYVTAKPDMSDAEKSALTEAVKKVGDETDEMQIAGDKGILGSLLKRGPLMLLDPQKVDTSDEELPNFKLGVDRKTGIRTPLEGKWMPSLAGFGVVWLRSDGKLVQATGRHRNQKAREANEPMWNVVLRESDGWTKEKMALIDGTFNIKDGKGDVADYVRFFEDSGFDRKDAEENGLLSDKGLVAWSIYADATDATRAATDLTGSGEEGKITPEQASIIAQAAPKGENPRNGLIQSVLLRKAQAGKRGEAFRGYARMMANDLRASKANANLTEGQQMDLFMNDPEVLAIDALNEKRSAYMMKKSGEFADQANLLRTAITKGTKLELRPEAAKALGIEDANDKEQLKAAYDKALHLSDYWNPAKDHVLDEADKSAMDAEINAKADANAKRREELKAKLAAVKSGKPLPKKAVSKKETTAPKPAEKTAKQHKSIAGHDKVFSAMTEAQRDYFDKQKSVTEDNLSSAELNDNGSVTFKTNDGFVLTINDGGTAEGGFAEKKSATPAKPPQKPRTVVMKNADEEKKADAALADIDFDTDLASDFGNAERYGKWLGKFKFNHSKARQNEWSRKNGVDFSTEFDYEKFGKLVAGVGKLVDVLTESGHKDFKALATFISERDADKYKRAKAVLQDVWNAVARQKGLERVSDAQADEVFGIIDKEAENGRTTGDDQRRDAGSGGSLGGALPPNDAQPAAEEAARGESVQRGEGSAGAPVQGTGRGQGRDLGGDQGGRDNPAGGAAGRGEPGKGVKDSSADRGNDRPAVPVQQGKAQGEQRPASDGVDAGAQGREGGLDAGRSERGTGGADGAEPVAKADASVKRAAKKAVEKTGPVYTDFVMTPAVEDAILEKSAIKRVRNNVAAIKLLQELKERDFKATPGEQEILAKYVGWGGLSEMFSWDYERAWEAEKRGDTDDAKDYAKGAKYGAEGYEAYKEIRQTLNDEEYAAAKETVLTAFYTPIQMVRLEHEALRKLGVTGGRFLGPSAGVGNYASAAGNYAKGANWQFVEKDQVSGQILRALFPNQRVHIGGYEETKLADSFFDFAIDNVPYADIDITDKSIGKSPYKIHDYFFAKTLSKLRPGGVMMFLTSTGTLDKTDGKLRQFLSQNGGKIVGAVRLPNGFFSKNAGTDVASDLVIIQRVNGEADNTGFMEQQKYGTDTEYVRRQGRVQVDLTYNKYFADNPGQVIGEMKVGSGQYGRTMLEYKMPKGDMFAKVGEAIDNALSGIDREALMKSAPAIEQKDHAPVYDSEGLRQGNITLKGEKLYEKSGNELVEVEMPKLSAAQKKRIAGKMLSPKKIVEKIIGVRKALRSVVDAEVNGMDDEHLQPLIDNLNEVYDDFVKRVGTFHDKTVTPFVMLDKADGNRLMTMEKVTKVDGNDVIEKADILKKRVIFTYQKPTKADTLADALTISYSEYGYIRWDRIGELMGIPSDDVGKRLVDEGLAFENPQTGIHEPYWEYLSGHVRRKLEAARAAMQNDPAFAKNVEALEKVQPKDVSLDEVTIKFGNTWVDPDAMIDFLKEMYDIRGYQDVKLTKNETLKKWNLELPRSSVEPFGAITFTQEHFLQAVLNSESLEVRAKDPITEKYYVLERETEAQKLAAEKLHEAFARFLRTSEKWYEPSNRSFNLVMNDNVAMKLPNNILPLRAAGMSEDVIKKLHAKGREYQPAVIARGVLGGKSLCLAHCVGAGKTLEMQSIGMIGRHLGMFKKSMYVVPNHMLDQFCNEFLAAFPNANILKMSTEDVQPKNRRAFFAKVANGDWDAIVVKHSTFSQKLPMTEKWQKDYLEREVRRLTDAKLAAKGDKASAKDIEKMIVRAKEKIKKLDSSDKKDSEIVPFEELGVDQLFVDEAHNFKGLPIVSSQARKVKGLAQGDSQRALDMEMKTQYVQSLHDGKRGVVFATGTPLSNAPVVEAYVNLRYLAPWALEEQGISSFDDFVNTFGRIETESEFGIDGKSTKEVQRVTAFVNIPEMMRLFKSVVDIVNSDQIKVKRPKMVMEAVPVQMSDAQAAIMEMVANESAIPPTKEERSKFLTLSGIAKRACISPRLLGVDDDGSKMIACANKVKQVFDETSDVRGAQLIFTDIFNSSDADGVVKYVGGMDGYTGNKWNLNDHLKELLVRSGIPAEQIGVIHDVDKAKGGDEGKDAAKEALFAKVRSGEIRVLIGSRPRMGEGTNVQERLAAIHLLHPGWKPSEDTQAIGRIIRPGNIFESGKVFYYLTQGNKNIGSYETKNHELIGVKDRLIQAVMHGDETVREIDLDEASAERDMLMGLASANQDLIKLIDVKRVLHKAELNVESVGFSARSNADNATRTERALEKAKEDFAEQERGAKEWREKNADGSFVLTVPDGRKLESMKDMAEYVSAQVTKQLEKDRYDRDERLEIGNFGGVPLNLSCSFSDNKIHLSVPSLGYAKEISYSGFLADFSPQAMTAFKGRIMSELSPDMEDVHKQTIADTENRIKRLKADAERFNEEWQKEKEKLTKLRAEKERLERAVTPLLVQTTEDHKYTTYGNWAITKSGSAYKAVRQSDGKEIKAGTVKELLPRMDAEDFSAPGRGANKTVDLAPIVNKRGGDDKNPVKTVAADEVDFDTYLFDVFGPSGKETIEVNNAKSLKQARSRAIFRYFTGGESRKLSPRERGAYNDVDTYIRSFNNIPLKTVIIRAGEHADKYEAGLRKYLTEHPEVEDRARRLAVSRKDSIGNSGRVGRSSEPRIEGSGSGGRILPSNSRLVGGLTQGTFSDLGVDFDTNLTPEEAAYAESEDKAPTEKVMREVFGMTNEDIETAMRAAKMEPPRHETKSDARTWEQAEVLLSRPEYMAKLSRAVYKVGRPVTDYENFALNEFFRERQEKVNELTELLNDMMAMPEEALADPETAQMLKDTKRDLAEARQLMYETGVAARQAASEQGRALRSNRGLLDKHDLTFAGILGQISSDAGGIARVTAEMDARIKEISEEFGKLDEEGKEIATARLKAFSEKIVNDIKNGGRVRRASEKMVGDEAKRVNRNYLDALAQIEVHAAEAGDTLIGLVDQMYPSWGRWLKYLGEYHCFMNPEISEDDCIKAIVEDIQPFLSGIDENQVRDMLTGFGHNYRQSRYDSQRLMNDLRSQARMKRQLDYMNENNQLPPATGMVRDEPSQTARQLAKEVQERKKEVDETNGGANRLKGALAAAKTRVKNRIEDLQRAIDSGEKIPGRERTVREDEELRQLKAHKDSLQAIYDNMFKTTNGVTDEQRVRMVEKALAKELERTMADYARAMSGDFSGRAKRPSVTSETAEELRGKIRETRNLILELKKANYEFGLTPDEIAKRNARKVAAREAAIIRMAERIERGDIRPMKKPQPPMPADLQARYDEMGRQLKRAHQKLADMRLDAQNATVPAWRRRGAEFVKFLTASQRALMATMDFSAVLRQAARISLGHPKIAYKSFGKSVRAMANDVRLSEINDEIMSDASVREAVEKYGLHMRDVDAANGRDVEMFHGMERNRIRMFGKEIAITDIPLFGELMLKSERHYITYLNSVSAELYTALANDKTRFPDGPTPWQKKAICDMINMWNGSGAISKERRSAMLKSGINEVFWAPGLAISRIQTAAGYDIWAPIVSKGIANEQGGYDAPSAEERKTMAKLGLAEHVKSSLAMIALGALVKFITADDDDWYQFGQADWFEKLMMLASPKVGNTTIDLTGGERSVYDLAHTLVTGRKRTSTGRTQKLGEGYKAPDAVSVVQRFMEGKWSPWLSEAFALYNGKDYTGQQYGLMQFLANKIPLSASDIKDQVTMNGIGTSLLTVPLTLLGAGGSTYDRKPYENAVNPFLEAKKEYDAVAADESIEDGEREAKLSQMREDNPLLRDEVREDIAADLAAIRKDENRAKRMEKNGEEPDAELNDQIEQGKREVLEKIRKYRR